MNKALDKTSIVGALGRGFAYPAWGILPKGFVGNSYDALATEDPNIFDVEAAKKLLADAGFPDGKGFPEFELWIRSPTPYFTSFLRSDPGGLERKPWYQRQAGAGRPPDLYQSCVHGKESPDVLRGLLAWTTGTRSPS